MKNQSNSLIQHFNPSCRTARLFPHLTVSRLLLSLNDYDLPIESFINQLNQSKSLYNKIHSNKIIGSIVTILSSLIVIIAFILSFLPDTMKDMMVEFSVIPMIHVPFIVIYYCYTKSLLLLIVVICTFIVMISILFYYNIFSIRSIQNNNKNNKQQSLITNDGLKASSFDMLINTSAEIVSSTNNHNNNNNNNLMIEINNVKRFNKKVVPIVATEIQAQNSTQTQTQMQKSSNTDSKKEMHCEINLETPLSHQLNKQSINSTKKCNSTH